MVSYETSSDGLVTLIRAKIRKGLLKKIEKYLPNPNYKIHLDDIGSFIWLHCDGKRTVWEICEMLGEKYGEKVDPVIVRTSQFIVQLARNHLIALERPENHSNQTL